MESPLCKSKSYLPKNKTLIEKKILTLKFFFGTYGMFLFYMIFFNVFVFQFCDVAKVVIIHKFIYLNLATKNMKGKSFNIYIYIGYLFE
jgi:hypothetical protein